MTRVLVTGGAGYIGSHAVRALLDDGHPVVVLDDLSAGHAEAVPPTCRWCERAIHDREAVAAALREHEIDAVMHFAAWLSVADSVRDPLGYYQNNVVGSLTLLAAMVEAGVSSFVFSSTCAVYGEPSSVPIDETLETQPDQRVRRDQARDRARASAPGTGARSSLDRAALLQRRRRPSGRDDRRGSRPARSTSFRGRSRRPPVDGRCRCSARTIRRRTAPACATTFTCATWPTRTSARCGRSQRGGGIW